MSVRRVMGTETEYAVSCPADPHANAVRLSSAVVSGAADPRTSHIRWDYRQEDPVNDARGHRLPRSQVRPDMLTDAPQLQITNVMAPNGGRIYVDHAHPEYSAPETLDPFEAVRYDRAGDVLMLHAANTASRRAGTRIALHRNNADGKGASWGTHENYMMRRSVPFDLVASLLTAHFISRQIYVGSGRVGLGESSETPGFQLSQRADFIHVPIGLQTTFDRPIINTRDEPHSGPAFRRVHGIVGDANRMDVPQALKLGTTSMVLWLLESGQEHGIDLAGLFGRLMLEDPVASMHVVSHDLGLGSELRLEGGGTTAAWLMQVELMKAVQTMGARIYDTDSRGEPQWPDDATRRVMAMWRGALKDVATIRHADDETRLHLTDEASRVEWLLKWQLMERLRRRLGTSWGDMRLAACDLRWAALDPQESIFPTVQGRTQRLCDDARLREACSQAPEGTRAWCRAELLHRVPERLVAMSWSHVTLRDETADRGMVTVDMSDPLGYTRVLCTEDDIRDGSGARDGCDAPARDDRDARGDDVMPLVRDIVRRR